MIIFSLMNSTIGTTGNGCSHETYNESISIERGESFHQRVVISPMWPFTGKDLVLKSNNGIVMGKCSGIKALDPAKLLFNITCWSRIESGFSMEIDEICKNFCDLDITIRLTEHSESGIYFIELDHGDRCRFWVRNILFRDFNPTCTSLFHRKSRTLKFSCEYLMSEQNGKSWLTGKGSYAA